MSEVLAAVAEGIAERLCTRVRAQDRLDALDEGEAAPTLLDRISGDGATVHDLAVTALSELLQSLTDARDRDALRTFREQQPAGVSAALMRTGMVVSGWDGSPVSVSPLGDASLQLFDALVADVEARVRERLQRDER